MKERILSRENLEENGFVLKKELGRYALMFENKKEGLGATVMKDGEVIEIYKLNR